MRNPKRFNGKTIATAAAGALALALVFSVGAASVAGQDYMAPRTAFGAPDLNGIWQAVGSHHWNIEPHAASHGPIVELGAVFSVPGGLGIVQGGEIPYTAAARALADWSVTEKANRIYNEEYAVVAMPGIAKPVKNFPPGIEGKMIDNDFQWAADNRIRLLDEWRRRYDGKSEPK